MSGFTDKYYFHGFLPEKKTQIENEFKNISKINASIVFFIFKKIKKLLI